MAHNYYLYEDGGRFSIIPWDLNMSFGGFNSGLSDEEIFNFFIDEPTAATVAEYPLVRQLLDEPEYLATYRAYLQQLIDGPFSVEAMTARINEIAGLIRPYVAEDDNSFFTLEEFEQGLVENLSSSSSMARQMGGSFIGLRHFVQERVASIRAQLSGELPASNGDGSGNGGSRGLGGMGGGGAPPGGAPPNFPGGGQMPGGAPPGGASPGGR
jgi:CotH kinase protein